MEKSLIISSIKFRDFPNNIEVYDSTIISTDLCFKPKEPLYDEYSIYCKIEEHMDLSINLHYLNKQTQCILTSLYTHKPSFVKTNIIYIALKDIVNVSQFSSLINTLDEVLFNDCGNFDTFWVQDKEYKLESLYYKQDSWSHDVSFRDVQPFKFNEDAYLTFDEGMFLIVMCNKWLACLSKVSAVSDNKKLTSITNRFEKRVEQSLQNIFEHLVNNTCDEEQLKFIDELYSSKKLKLA
jgi:hypothetical protein